MFADIITHDLRRPLAKRAASRKVAGPYHWTPAKPGAGRGFYCAPTSHLEMDRAGSSMRLRLEDAGDHLEGTRLAHVQAYTCDDDGFAELAPIVARLPRGRGFLAGWSMGAGMCASLDAAIYTDAEDAARAAHHLAERDADAERERDHDDDCA